MTTLFGVLAEDNRRRILDLLIAGDRPVGDLVEALDISQPAVSKHLRILREAGLVEVDRRAQQRVYRLQAEPLQSVDAWLAPYRRRWSRRLDALERHLGAMPDDDEGADDG